MSKHILTNGTSISYRSYNPNSQPTVIMIHGITGNHKGFQYILKELPDVHAIVPDLPGFGESDLPPTAEWNIDGLARLTNEFVESLKLPVPPIILGHSMGGLVVSSMVSQRPELYDKKVILISPVPTAVTAFDSRMIGAKLGALQYFIGSRAGSVGVRIVKSHKISRAATRVMVKTRDSSRRKDIYAHHIDNLSYFSDSAFYHSLHTDINRHGSIDYAPALSKKNILLITGDDDAVTPMKHMNRFANAISPSEYVVIPGVGHLIHYERAPEAAQSIAEFIAR